MRVTYTHRLGQHDTGTTVTLPDSEARWLIRRGHALPAESSAHAPDTTTPPEDTPDTHTATLAGLKATAERHGLPTYGTKAAIAARIARHTGG